ncbi:hypothetical protein V3C99_005026 [Haemonchus contortus]|uniref:Uncharacterized protein n=1 Tax=Haemonchus contortus TaxID=6289 RepID=A0A7I4XTP1_HAECO
MRKNCFCNSRSVGFVDVLVNTPMTMSNDLYESLTTLIGRSRVRRCGSISALTILAVVGDFKAEIGPRRTDGDLHIGTHGVEWNMEGGRLPEFIISSQPIHGNSQGRKPSHLRWTRESPGGHILMK